MHNLVFQVRGNMQKKKFQLFVNCLGYAFSFCALFYPSIDVELNGWIGKENLVFNLKLTLRMKLMLKRIA